MNDIVVYLLLIAGFGLGILAAGFAVRALTFTLPFTRMLDIHNVHRRPDAVRRNTLLLLAVCLLIVSGVCVAAYVGSMRVERTLIYVLPMVFLGALLALLTGRIGLRAAPGLIQRYYVRHREDLDPEAFPVFLTDTDRDPGDNPDAQFQFGLQKYASKGKGNRAEAVAWLRKAAAQGHPVARSMLAKLLGTDDKDANTDVVRSLMMSMSFSEMTGERMRGGVGGAGGGGQG